MIVTFHEIAINYKSQLKTESIFVGISANQNVGSSEFFDFKFCQIIYLFKTFIMLGRIFIYAVDYLVTAL